MVQAHATACAMTRLAGGTGLCFGSAIATSLDQFPSIVRVLQGPLMAGLWCAETILFPLKQCKLGNDGQHMLTIPFPRNPVGLPHE
jgi:hypothetical protein